MRKDIDPHVLPRRAIIVSFAGMAAAALLNACGGGKAPTVADAPFATNAAINTAGAASSQGATPVSTGSSAVASPVAGATPAGTTIAGSVASGTASSGSAPPATHITGVGPLPKPLPTQGGAPPTVVGVSPVSSAAGTPASVPSQTLATASAAPAAQVTIAADGAFSPAQVTIRTGQAIQWVNGGRAPQTATGDPARAANKQDAVLPAGAQPWDSGVLNPGARYAHSFTTPGDYVYFSIPFEGKGMTGRITVTS